MSFSKKFNFLWSCFPSFFMQNDHKGIFFDLMVLLKAKHKWLAIIGTEAQLDETSFLMRNFKDPI